MKRKKGGRGPVGSRRAIAGYARCRTIKVKGVC